MALSPSGPHAGAVAGSPVGLSEMGRGEVERLCATPGSFLTVRTSRVLPSEELPAQSRGGGGGSGGRERDRVRASSRTRAKLQKGDFLKEIAHVPSSLPV